MTEHTSRLAMARTPKSSHGAIVIALLLTACSVENAVESPGYGAPIKSEAVDKAYFQSVEEMTAAAEIVAKGTVSDVIPVEMPDLEAPEGETAFEQAAHIMVETGDLFKGSAESDTLTVWFAPAYLLYVDEEILHPFVFDGFTLPSKGDVVFVFLESSGEKSDDGTELLEFVSFDGMLRVEAGKIETDLVDQERLAVELEGISVDELETMIRQAGA